MMRQTDLDAIVLQYLRKKGYSITEQWFQHEGLVSKADDPSAPAPEDGEKGLQDLIFYASADCDPAAYVDAYGRLAAWVDASLDLYRPELQRVLYPLAAHTYLALVAAGAASAAADLLARHRRSLVAMAGRGASARAQELQELAALGGQQQMALSGLARALRGARLPVRLSAYAYALLLGFLQGGRHWLMLGIINQHLRLTVHEGPPAADAGEDASLVAALRGGSDAAGGGAGALGALRLGLLRGGAEDAAAAAAFDALERRQRQRESAAAAEGEGGGGEGGGGDAGGGGGGAAATQEEKVRGRAGVTKKARERARERARVEAERRAAAAREQRERIEASRLDPWIPHAPLPERLREAALADLRARADVGPGALPSCALLTFTNTHQSLSAVTIGADASRVAAGFTDGTVRLYDLAALAAQRVAAAAALRSSGGGGDNGATPAAKRESAPSGNGGGGEAGGSASQEAPTVEEMQEALGEACDAAALTELRGHSGPVTALSLTPDGQLLLSCSTDGSVRCWALALGACVAVYRAHVWPVWCVAASPLGTYFVSGGADRVARVWSTASVAAVRVLAGHTGDVSCVAWHPNGHYAVTGSTDRSARLWDVATGACVRVLSAQPSPVTALAVSPCGGVLAAGCDDGGVAAYALAAGERAALLRGHEGPVWGLGFSCGAGSLLASGGADGSVRVWSAPPNSGSLLALAQAEEAAAAAAAALAAGRAPPEVDSEKQGGGDGAAEGEQKEPQQPWQLLRVYRTRGTPVMAAGFTPRNLLMASGALTLRGAARPRH